ncbi:hypothetical protein ScPMuIL_016527 [Solemya velum]
MDKNPVLVYDSKKEDHGANVNSNDSKTTSVDYAIVPDIKLESTGVFISDSRESSIDISLGKDNRKTSQASPGAGMTHVKGAQTGKKRNDQEVSGKKITSGSKTSDRSDSDSSESGDEKSNSESAKVASPQTATKDASYSGSGGSVSTEVKHLELETQKPQTIQIRIQTNSRSKTPEPSEPGTADIYIETKETFFKTANDPPLITTETKQKSDNEHSENTGDIVVSQTHDSTRNAEEESAKKLDNLLKTTLQTTNGDPKGKSGTTESANDPKSHDEKTPTKISIVTSKELIELQNKEECSNSDSSNSSDDEDDGKSATKSGESDSDKDDTLWTLEDEAKVLAKFPSMSDKDKNMYMKFFHFADQENRGYMSIHNFQKSLRAMGIYRSDDFIVKMFLDVNSTLDGRLTLEQYMTEMAKKNRRDITKDDLLGCYRHVDKDNDGLLSADDIRQMMDEANARFLDITITDMIAREDMDKDGKLDYKDFVRVCGFQDIAYRHTVQSP